MKVSLFFKKINSSLLVMIAYLGSVLTGGLK
jgi:hypothetical protein